MLAHLFDRFYRVENSRNRATGGAGLGLAISRNIAEAHQGAMTAQASPLGGIWISVTLPLAGKEPA
jgi:two-component system sensor histidine kinase BaeS